jgi:site-specific recombinase XerC
VVNIRNPHTRQVYYRAAEEFLAWCTGAGVPSIAAVQLVHVATWIEASTRELAAPSVKQRFAALRHLFDWLVNGQVVPIKPAHAVRGPRHVVTCGQTPVLDPAEARALLDSIDAGDVVVYGTKLVARRRRRRKPGRMSMTRLVASPLPGAGALRMAPRRCAAP